MWGVVSQKAKIQEISASGLSSKCSADPNL